MNIAKNPVPRCKYPVIIFIAEIYFLKQSGTVTFKNKKKFGAHKHHHYSAPEKVHKYSRLFIFVNIAKNTSKNRNKSDGFKGTSLSFNTATTTMILFNVFERS